MLEFVGVIIGAISKIVVGGAATAGRIRMGASAGASRGSEPLALAAGH